MIKRLLILLLFITNTVFAQETVILDEQFDNNNNNWNTYSKGDFLASIKNGKYILQCKNENAYWSLMDLDLKADSEDFTIETSITQTKGVDNYGFGIVWSMYSDKSAFQKFLIASNQMVLLDDYYKKKSHYYMNWTAFSEINKMKSKNIFKVDKTANIVTVWVNGKQIFKGGSFNYFGKKIGFYISNKMTIEIDYLKVTKRPKNIDILEQFDKDAKKIKLGSNINSEDYSEVMPVISADGKTLFCVRKNSPDNFGDKQADDVWFAKLKENGEWGDLTNFGKPINNESHNFLISISPDNNTMLTGNTYKEDGTSKGSGVSVSRKQINGWEIPKDLKIEDYYNNSEFVAYYMGADNKTLLMCVNRKDSYGDKDIYVSFEKEDKSWSKPMNLGNTVNTFGDEGTIYLASDNKTLFYSTTGLPGYGYDDIFVTKRLDDTWTNWSKPKNLGPIINTPGSELGYFMTAKGDYAYISSRGDIYKIPNAAKTDPVILVSGVVYNKKTNQPMTTEIKYYDLKKNQLLGSAISDPKTGEYKIVLPVGKFYSFLADKEGFYSISENLDVHELKEYTELTRNLYLSPIEKGETIRLNNIFFESAKSGLKEESFNELNRLVDILAKSSDLKIEIGGHTDDKGTNEYNLTLSRARAKSVMNYLISKGIPKTQITSKGYGESSPQVKNDSEENRAINRRVEFKVL